MSIFYVEDLGISADLAERVARFVAIAHKHDLNPNVWSKNGVARVYFEPWSQNSLRVFHLAEKWFFDAVKNEVFATGYLYGASHVYTLRKIVSCSTRNFSGEKTKARLVRFAEAFYG